MLSQAPRLCTLDRRLLPLEAGVSIPSCAGEPLGGGVGHPHGQCPVLDLRAQAASLGSLEMQVLEFPLWCKGISSVFRALGRGFDPRSGTAD